MIKYTTINHLARVHLGLSQNQYTIADSIHKLSTNPESKHPGWCSASKVVLAEFIGDVKPRTIVNYINHLVELGLVERDPGNAKRKRTTKLWYDVVINWSDYCENIAHHKVQTLHGKGEKTARDGVQTLHGKGEKFAPPSNSSKDNSIDSSKDKGVRPFVNPLSKSLDERREELISCMTRQEMHLHHVCRTTGKSMTEMPALIAAWAKENEATQFQSEQHQRNSFKKFVTNTNRKSLYQPAETPTKMSRPMLIRPLLTNG